VQLLRPIPWPILRSRAISLEITFPFARSDAVIYDVRLRWHGRAFISRAARFSDDDPPELTEETPFGAWDHKRDWLCDKLDAALATNRPQYWAPIDPFTKIAILPGTATLYQFCHWTTEEGRMDLAEERAAIDAVQSDEDEFTVHVWFDPTHQLRYVEDAERGGGDFGFSIYTERGPLSQFAKELRAEFNDCQSNRKMPPSGDDTLWRLTH
jgi:hypothetical protein